MVLYTVCMETMLAAGEKRPTCKGKFMEQTKGGYAQWKILAIVAGFTGLAASPAVCQRDSDDALAIYAAAGELDDYAKAVAGKPQQRAAAPAAVPAPAQARVTERGVRVVNNSGQTLDIFSYGSGSKPNYIGEIKKNHEVFITCPEGDVYLTFSARNGYRWELRHHFSSGSAGEVFREVLEVGQNEEHTSYAAKPSNEDNYNYIDIFGGLGMPKMSLEFANANKSIYLNQIGIGGPNNGPYSSVKWEKLKTDGFGLAGVRFGGYGQGYVGGAFEISMEKRNIKRQVTSFRVDGKSNRFIFNSGDYLKVTSYYAIGNIMFRFPKRTTIEPYVGFGGGLSLNRLEMPHVGGLKNSSSYYLTAPTINTTVGFVFNIPCGVRIQLSEKTQVVAEARYQINNVLFDRGGIAGEKDKLKISGLYYHLGFSVNF